MYTKIGLTLSIRSIDIGRTVTPFLDNTIGNVAGVIEHLWWKTKVTVNLKSNDYENSH